MKLTKFGILVNKTTSLFTSIRDSKISRGCAKILEILEGRGGHTADPFRGGGGGGYFLEPHNIKITINYNPFEYTKLCKKRCFTKG